MRNSNDMNPSQKRTGKPVRRRKKEQRSRRRKSQTESFGVKGQFSDGKNLFSATEKGGERSE